MWRYYGSTVSCFPPHLLYYLHCLLPKLQAEEELRERSIRSQLTPERAYELVYLTTGDSQRAEEVQSDLLLAEARRSSSWSHGRES